MTDRELLELAVKAAENVGCQFRISAAGSLNIDRDGYWVSWNPLKDDGDALRLAVKLGITIGIEYGRKHAHASGLIEKPIDGDLYSATRRVIVRAAAEIGKAMGEHGK